MCRKNLSWQILAQNEGSENIFFFCLPIRKSYGNATSRIIYGAITFPQVGSNVAL